MENKAKLVNVLKHLSPSVGQLRVPPEASLLVVMALSMATEVDGVGVHMDVHEVIHDFTLDVILHPIDQEATAHIDDLDEGQAPVGQGETRSQSCKHSRLRYLVLLVLSIVAYIL